MRAHRGEIFVEITSAEVNFYNKIQFVKKDFQSLSKKHEQALNDALQKFVKPGQKLHINYATKHSLLGGLIVTIGDKYVDLSIASRFNKLQNILSNAI